MVPVQVICLLPDDRESCRVRGILKTFPLFCARDIPLTEDSIERILKVRADLFLLNDRINGQESFALIEEAEWPGEVIIVSRDPALGVKAFEKGAAGFLIHPVTPEKMALALWRAYERLWFRGRTETY